MKAAVVERFGSVSDIQLRELPDPEPRAGEVLISVEAIEVNYPDILVVEGRYQTRPPLPFIPGKTAVGTVLKGSGDLTAGTRVIAHLEHGAYATRVAAPARSCCPVPNGVLPQAAASLGLAWQTAWFALVERGGLSAGQRVLVLGARGAVGSAAVALARALGATCVIAATRGARHAIGADITVASDGPDLRDRLRADVFAATCGHGVDIVIDPIGGDATGAALRSLAWCGRLIVTGFAAGDIPTIRTNYVLVKNIAVLGLQWSDYRDRQPDRIREVQASIFRLTTSGEISLPDSRTVPLVNVREALMSVAHGADERLILVT
jgi:NADPH2:quinone reductase